VWVRPPDHILGPCPRESGDFVDGHAGVRTRPGPLWSPPLRTHRFHVRLDLRPRERDARHDPCLCMRRGSRCLACPRRRAPPSSSRPKPMLKPGTSRFGRSLLQRAGAYTWRHPRSMPDSRDPATALAPAPIPARSPFGSSDSPTRFREEPICLRALRLASIGVRVARQSAGCPAGYDGSWTGCRWPSPGRRVQVITAAEAPL